jgi:Reverse transcriptase (RNA-dependent DNA polymerase)
MSAINSWRQLYVYREKVKHWTGPHIIAQIDGREVLVHLGESTGPRSFNISQTKPELVANPVRFTESVCEKRENFTIRWTEVLHPADPKIKSDELVTANKNEIMGLINRGTFRIEVIPDEELRNKNIVPRKFVYALKHENGKVAYKDRLCLGGHRDLMKNLVVHTASTLRQQIVRLLLALAAIVGLEVWSTDVAQAYLQSAVPLQRYIFCKTDALELGPN